MHNFLLPTYHIISVCLFMIWIIEKVLVFQKDKQTISTSFTKKYLSNRPLSIYSYFLSFLYRYSAASASTNNNFYGQALSATSVVNNRKSRSRERPSIQKQNINGNGNISHLMVRRNLP